MGQGDEGALERLIPLVYQELHRIARRYMAGERAGHSLQATALVNEVYLRLVDVKAVAWQNRAHFLAVVGASDAPHPGRSRARSALSEARRRCGEGHVRRSARRHQRAAAGLRGARRCAQGAGEIRRAKEPRHRDAILWRPERGRDRAVLNVSPDTVMRDWRLAKVWLRREMRGERSHDA